MSLNIKYVGKFHFIEGVDGTLGIIHHIVYNVLWFLERLILLLISKSLKKKRKIYKYQDSKM